MSLLVLAGCSKEKAPPPRPPAPVVVAQAQTKDVPVQVTGIGTVEASASVAVKPRVSGQLTAVHFTEGEDVREGDRLFTIDERPFAAALRQARAQLAKDEAAARYAATEAKRFAALVQAGVASREIAEQHAAESRATQAVVAGDRAAVDAARLNLSYCTIRAPMTGRTGTVQVKAGNVVQADTTTLVVINRIHPIYVGFSVPERELPGLQAALSRGPLPMTASPPGSRDGGAMGQLQFLENAVDPATGTIRLRGTFPNEDDRLWPGQFVDVRVTVASLSNVVVVPSAAVQTGQQGAYVYIVTPQRTALLRNVTTGPVVGDQTVIQSGVAAGDTVVTDGQLRLVPGAKVAIQSTPVSEVP